MMKTNRATRGLPRIGWSATLAATLLATGCGGGGGDQQTLAEACRNDVNDTTDKLLQCVTLSGVQRHQAALQSIAEANNGMRASGTTGYNASVDYAAQVLRDAGYVVTTQAIQFQSFIELSAPKLEQVQPAPAAPLTTYLLTYSGNSNTTAPVTALAGPSTDPTPGCEAADFATFTPGHIALISRGSCPFAMKATNAQAAGASGVVIYNNVDGELNTGTLGESFTPDIGVVSVSQAVGMQLAATPGLMLSLKTETFRGTATTHNVTAESRGGDANNVVMVGAHLDSVDEGPGINDNGSGTAAVLETAVQMAKVEPRNKIRFAIWAAEESGLVGSTRYVNALTPAEKSQIALYLNFDMIGSPNYGLFIYDGDNSDGVGEGPGPAGSAQIESMFETFYKQRGKAFKGTDYDGRSDYRAFIQNGIPAGGLFTGAEGIKTAEEAALWGGTAGQAYDPCYHKKCDNTTNASPEALDLNADAVAYATLMYAMDISTVKAQREKGNNFRMPPLRLRPTDPVAY